MFKAIFSEYNVLDVIGAIEVVLETVISGLVSVVVFDHSPKIKHNLNHLGKYTNLEYTLIEEQYQLLLQKLNHLGKYIHEFKSKINRNFNHLGKYTNLEYTY